MEIRELPVVVLDSDDDGDCTTPMGDETELNIDDPQELFTYPGTSLLGPFQEVLIDWDETSRRKRKEPSVRPLELDFWLSTDSFRLAQYNVELSSGMDVELHGEVFLRIHDIVTDPHTSASFFRGHVFLRNGQELSHVAKDLLSYEEETMANYLKSEPNEVHMSLHYVNRAQNSREDQSLRLFPVDCFVRIRSIIKTNTLFPALSEKTATGDLPMMEHSKDALICRWVTVKEWDNSRMRDTDTRTHCRWEIRRFRQMECGEQFAVSDTQIMADFRGPTIIGGDTYGIHQKEYRRRKYEELQLQKARNLHPSGDEQFSFLEDVANEVHCTILDTSESNSYLEIDESDTAGNPRTATDEIWLQTQETFRPMLFPRRQRYSVADIFCGCGGATVAATKAGFCAKYAVDKEKKMCATYLLNNPATRVACADVRDFLYKYAYEKKVDIMHFSPPCQPLSKAHTTPGKNDEANLEALGTLEPYLCKAKPRIVTVEEADALATFSKHRGHLQRIITQLTMQNYSVEFKIVRLADYGVCQKRQRLVLIASCPGQRLPGFPEKTHCSHEDVLTTNLFPWVSREEAIAEIPHKWTHHDPADERLLREGEEGLPGQLSTTLITKNAHLLHPEGWRRYTIMEKLVIQGFPLHFEFPLEQQPSDMERQVGNAVPPIAFEVIFRHVEQELLRDDGMLDERTGRRRVW